MSTTYKTWKFNTLQKAMREQDKHEAPSGHELWSLYWIDLHCIAIQLRNKCLKSCLPLQKTLLVVSSGKECRRLNLICVPNFEKVPVPVLSSLNAPFSITSSTMSRYCNMRDRSQPYGDSRGYLHAPLHVQSSSHCSYERWYRSPQCYLQSLVAECMAKLISWMHFRSLSWADVSLLDLMR